MKKKHKQGEREGERKNKREGKRKTIAIYTKTTFVCLL